MSGPLITPDIERQPLSVATQPLRFETTFSQAASASLERALDFNPVPSLLFMHQLERAQGDLPAQRDRLSRLLAEGIVEEPPPRFTQDEWVVSEFFREGLQYPNDGWTPSAAALMAERFDRRERQDFITSKVGGGFFTQAGLFAIEVGGSLVDPLSIGASFVPVVGQARYASMLARHGRTKARALRGSVEAFVGNVPLEGLVLSSQRLQQADYDMSDALLNLAFGTAFGTGLHVGVGAIGDAVGKFRGQTHELAVRKAIEDIAEGNVVDVVPIIRDDPYVTSGAAGLRNDLLTGTALAPPRVRPASRTSVFEPLGPDLRARRVDPSFSGAEIDTPITVRVASVNQSGKLRVFPTESKARAAARRSGEAFGVEKVEGGFRVTRDVPLNLVRRQEVVGGARAGVSDIVIFPSERAARAAAASDDVFSDATPIPIGSRGEFALARGIDEQTAKEIAADPTMIEPRKFLEETDDRFDATQVPGDELPPEEVAKIRQSIRAALGAELAPRPVPRVTKEVTVEDVVKVFDETSGEVVDEDVLQDVADMRAAGRVLDEDDEVLNIAKEEAAQAENLVKAYSAAAVCMARNAR